MRAAGRIYLLRVRKGITQAELSARSGIPQANLSNIERGRQDPTVSTLLKICSALGVTPAEFFSEEPETPPVSFTRASLERVAKAAAGESAKLSEGEQKIAALLQALLPDPRRKRGAARTIYHHWYELKRRLSHDEIKILVERVREAKEQAERRAEERYQKLLQAVRTRLGERGR